MQAREDAASIVEVRTFKDHYEENKHIIYTIKEEMAKKTPLSQIAILYRTNQGPRQLIAALMAYNIPFYMQDAVPNLFDHWISQKYHRLYAPCDGRSQKKHIFKSHEPPQALYQQGISD